MANTKISGLSSASTPLSGSEILPINQSGVTDSVSVANLTAGRAVAAQALTLTNGEVYLILNATGGKQWDIIAGGGGNITPGYLSFWNGTNGNKVFSIAPSTSEQFTTDTSGNFNMVAGNVVQGTSGKGFNFTANTPYSGKTTQLLSVYEEGTWSPSITGLTYIGTPTVEGQYTIMGDIAFIRIQVSGATSVASSGTVYFPIPFANVGRNGVLSAVTSGTLSLPNGRVSTNGYGYFPNFVATSDAVILAGWFMTH